MLAAWHFQILDEPARILHPEYLWLVAAVAAAAALLCWVSWRRMGRIHAVIPERLTGRVLPGLSRTRPLVRIGLSCAGLLLLTLALTQPQVGTGVERVSREGIDLVVVLDASRSMLARDIAPSRFERARLELSTLLDELRGDRFGLVAFAGTPIVQVPMTTDHRAARMYLRALHPEHMPRQGTNIGAGLRTAHRMLTERGASRSQVVVLISDGEDHHRDARETAERLAADGIVIFTIGIGSADGDLVPQSDERGFHRDRTGGNVLTRVDEALLRDIATLGGGTYVNTRGRGIGVSEVMDAVRAMEQDEHEVREVIRYEDQSTWLLFPGFILLLAGALVRPGRPRPAAEAVAAPARGKTPGPTARAAILLLATGLGVGLPSAAEARRLLEAEHPRIAEGNRAYAEGRYDEAIEAYESMLEEPLEPEQQAVVHYNRGTAYAARGDIEKAREAFDASIALGGPQMQARDYYNLGTGLLNSGDAEGARDALTESLRRDPTNRAAQHNLELALRMLRDPPPPSDMGSDDQDDPESGEDDEQDTGDDEARPDDEGEDDDDADDREDGDRDEEDEGESGGDPTDDPDEDSGDDESGDDDSADDESDDGEGEPGDDDADSDDGSEEGDRDEGDGEDDRQDGDEREDDSAQPDQADAGDEQADAQADPSDADEDGDEEGGQASGPVEIDEQDVHRILDALEARESPLQPFLFRPQTELEQYTEEEKDW
jgi:Ca-activated chloride channel homolog